MRTPEPIPGRQNIDIQTDQFVEELTDKAPNYEIGCQTDISLERAVIKLYIYIIELGKYHLDYIIGSCALNPNKKRQRYEDPS